MIDGGVRSGADVVKALALGAKAVGLGRPFLYANGTHGQDGVVRVCQSMSSRSLFHSIRIQLCAVHHTTQLLDHPLDVLSRSTTLKYVHQLIFKL